MDEMNIALAVLGLSEGVEVIASREISESGTRVEESLLTRCFGAS